MIALACSIDQNWSHNVQYPDSQSCAQIKGFDPSRYGSSLLEPNSSPISFLHDHIAAGRFSSTLQIKKIIGSNSSHFVYCSSRALSLPLLSCLECLPYRWRTLPSTASLTSKLINSTVLFFYSTCCLPIISSSPLYNTAVFPSKFSFWLHDLVDIKHSLKLLNLWLNILVCVCLGLDLVKHFPRNFIFI